MHALGDEMATAGKPLDDEELVSYICTGLELEFESVVSSAMAHVDPITVSDLYSQLLAAEQRREIYHWASS